MSGTTLRGLIKLNDTLLLGPDPLGNFLSIAVKSIHRKRMPVKEVRGGQTASFALKKVSVNIRRWLCLGGKNDEQRRITNIMQPLHFSGVKTEAQRGDVICLKSCN